MGKDHPVTPQKHKNMNCVKIVISVLVTVILLMADLLCMTDNHRNYIIIAVITILMLLSTYVLVISLLSESQRKAIRREEQYESIFKSEKATYVRLRKSFDELESRLTEIETIMDGPRDEIIAAQKSLAKITINRTKENTDALLNSNDKLIDKMLDLETQLTEKTGSEDTGHQEELVAGIQELLQKQAEIVEAIKALENEVAHIGSVAVQSAPVEEELGSTIGQFSFEEEAEEAGIPEELVEEEVVEPFEASVEEEVAEPVEETVEEVIEPVVEAVEEEVVEPFEASVEEAIVEPVEETVEEEIVEPVGEAVEEEIVEPLDTIAENTADINELGFGDEPTEEVMEDVGDTNELGFGDEPADINALGFGDEPAEAVVEDTTDVNELGFGDEAAEEPAELGFDEISSIADEVLNDSSLLTDEEIAEKEAEETDAVEAEAPAEEPMAEPEEEEADVPPSPNKIMTPDEIAALIANTTAGNTPIQEEPEKKEEAPAAPAMDALSDPNKVMTADEIAALIANI